MAAAQRLSLERQLRHALSHRGDARDGREPGHHAGARGAVTELTHGRELQRVAALLRRLQRRAGAGDAGERLLSQRREQPDLVH